MNIIKQSSEETSGLARELGEKAQEIGNIINTIKNIAKQTY
ncbi:MAG: hypothetical protein JG777_2124 [Clostridia bacterium]|jgi:methyl-accepting chemotaxis protein|nr:hypothetical protein [Petroclostridium xylanilyticum]MBZ4646635.1 hypothetical protein [Clostridia bacterium]